jgi:hypothetical protein
MNADWIRPFVEAGLDGTARQERVDVLSKLNELADDGAWETINASLDQSQVEQLADSTLMTLVRGTYRFKSRLQAWDTFRNRVAVEFHRRGSVVERLMLGLS